MSIAYFDSLKNLIQSHSKTEKRIFRLFATRNHSEKELLFLKLFDLIERFPDREESYFIKRLDIQNTNQFINLKRHLFGQLLKSLNNISKRENPLHHIFQLKQYSELLHERGLYKESRSMTNKMNKLEYEFVDIRSSFYKQQLVSSNRLISKESQDISVAETEHKTDQLLSQIRLSKLITALYEEIKLIGFSRNNRESIMRKAKIDSTMDMLPSKLNIVNTFLKNHSLLLYQYSNCKIEEAYNYAELNFQLLQTNDILQSSDMYLKYYHYLLSFSRYLDAIDKFSLWEESYEAYLDQLKPKLKHLKNHSSYVSMHLELNKSILLNDYQSHQQIILKYEEWDKLKGDSSPFANQFFIYKIGLHKMYRGEYDVAIDYFSIIISDPQIIRKDILLYSRLLSALCHYRLSNFEYVENLLPGIRQAFVNFNRLTRTVDLMLSFTRRGIKMMNFGMRDEIQELKDKLDRLESDSFERESFLYFDFYKWLESVRRDLAVEQL